MAKSAGHESFAQTFNDVTDMHFNWANPYPTVRTPVFARNIVATSQPLAAQAGLRVMQGGGNAVDAAIATAFASYYMRTYAVILDPSMLRNQRSPQFCRGLRA